MVLDLLIVYGYFLNNIIPKLRVLKDITSHKLFILRMLLFAFFIIVAIQASVSSVTTKSINSYQVKDEQGIQRSYYRMFMKFHGTSDGN